MRAKAIVACAALLGYRFDARVLAACFGASAEEMLRALRIACREGILVADSGSGYRFRHNLCRAAIRESLDAAMTRALHARIAATLERLPEVRTDPARLAFHWTSAGNARRARPYRERAAAETFEVGSGVERGQ